MAITTQRLRVQYKCILHFAMRVLFLADHLISITGDLRMNIHVAHSAEQLAMTSDYGRCTLAGDGKSSGPIFSDGQICGFIAVCGVSRFVESRV